MRTYIYILTRFVLVFVRNTQATRTGTRRGVVPSRKYHRPICASPPARAHKNDAAGPPASSRRGSGHPACVCVCMYVCMYTHAHTHTQTHTHTHKHTHTHTLPEVHERMQSRCCFHALHASPAKEAYIYGKRDLHIKQRDLCDEITRQKRPTNAQAYLSRISACSLVISSAHCAQCAASLPPCDAEVWKVCLLSLSVCAASLSPCGEKF